MKKPGRLRERRNALLIVFSIFVLNVRISLPTFLLSVALQKRASSHSLVKNFNLFELAQIMLNGGSNR